MGRWNQRKAAFSRIHEKNVPSESREINRGSQSARSTADDEAIQRLRWGIGHIVEMKNCYIVALFFESFNASLACFS